MEIFYLPGASLSLGVTNGYHSHQQFVIASKFMLQIEGHLCHVLFWIRVCSLINACSILIGQARVLWFWLVMEIFYLPGTSLNLGVTNGYHSHQQFVIISKFVSQIEGHLCHVFGFRVCSLQNVCSILIGQLNRNSFWLVSFLLAITLSSLPHLIAWSESV